MKRPSTKFLILSALIGISFMSISFGTSFALLTDTSETKIEVSSAIYRVSTEQIDEGSNLTLSSSKTITIPKGFTSAQVVVVAAKTDSNVKIKYRLFTDFVNSDSNPINMSVVISDRFDGTEATLNNHETFTSTSWTLFDPSTHTLTNDQLEKATITFTLKEGMSLSEDKTYTIIYECVQGNRTVQNEDF